MEQCNQQVAIKVLIVIHRTLREGDPTFREELLAYSHRGQILQISNFKDDSSPLGIFIVLFPIVSFRTFLLGKITLGVVEILMQLGIVLHGFGHMHSSLKKD